MSRLQRFWNLRSVRKLRRDRIAVLCLAVIAAYFLTALVVALDIGGFLEQTMQREGENYEGPSMQNLLGTDRLGRDVLKRGLYSVKTAVMIGAISALVAVCIGTIIGAVAGYFGGKVDAAVIWLYSTIESVPYLLLLMAISYVAGKGAHGLYAAFCATFWVGPCRVVRGEVLKLREMEYVEAARVIGQRRPTILLRHVIPNTLHLGLVYFALLFIAAVKSEVILSFLGLGVQGEPSWGIMIDDARFELINGFYWQLGTATAMLFALVISFNLFADALQDALDPKHAGV